MSVEAIAIALHHGKTVNSTQMCVLIGIANHAGDGGAWPTVSTLAHYARIQRRRVQTVLRELEREGNIRCEVQGGGTHEIAAYDRPNLYHFLVKCPPNCDRSMNHKLLCQGCNKPLSRSLREELFHPGCVPVPADSAGGVVHDTPCPTEHPPHVVHNARGVSYTTPKPSLEPNHQLNKEPHELKRARERKADGYADDLPEVADAPESERQRRTTNQSDSFDLKESLSRATQPASQLSNSTDDERCPRRKYATHAFSKGGECIDCGALDPARINYETGEVA